MFSRALRFIYLLMGACRNNRNKIFTALVYINAKFRGSPRAAYNSRFIAGCDIDLYNPIRANLATPKSRSGRVCSSLLQHTKLRTWNDLISVYYYEFINFSLQFIINFWIGFDCIRVKIHKYNWVNKKL